MAQCPRRSAPQQRVVIGPAQGPEAAPRPENRPSRPRRGQREAPGLQGTGASLRRPRLLVLGGGWVASDFDAGSGFVGDCCGVEPATDATDHGGVFGGEVRQFLGLRQLNDEWRRLDALIALPPPPVEDVAKL